MANVELSETQPKVSLLIPCYNVSDSIDACLASACAQTLRDIEIICLNDGSTDDTLGHLRVWEERDPRIKVVDKQNEGYGRTMNRGLDLAHGEFIAILESDDTEDPEGLERLYDTAQRFEADAVKCNFYRCYENTGDVIRTAGIRPEETGFVFRPIDVNRQHVFYVPPSIWAGIYRTSYLREHDIRFTETPGASFQDTAWNFKVWFWADRAVLMDDAFLRYRNDNANSSVHDTSKVFCVCDEYEEMERAVDSCSDQARAEAARPLLVRMKYNTYRWNFDRLAEEQRREFILRFSREFHEHEERGEIDWDRFEPGTAIDLHQIMDEPLYFLDQHYDGPARGKFRTAWRYFRDGGMRYVARVLHDR